MVIDRDARRNELITATNQGTLTYPPYFHSLTTTGDLEPLSQFVAEHETIMALSPRAHSYNCANEIYWREQAEIIFGQLHYAQTLPEGPQRNRTINQTTESVLAAEEQVATFGNSAIPGWIRYGVGGKIEIKASDQVVIAAGNISVRALRQKLAAVGQCLPFPPVEDQGSDHSRTGAFMSLQSAISLNLPHALEAQCGSWRDWVLGMTVMLGDGSVVKSGSQVVKNVAGYDAHKLFIGARGTLGIIVEVILKTHPLESLPKHAVEIRRKTWLDAYPTRKQPTLWIQRTKPSDFAYAVKEAGDRILEIDWASNTLWADVLYDEELPRYTNDWVMRRGCLDKNVVITDPTQIALMKKAKAILDPKNKFNPGAMGVV